MKLAVDYTADSKFKTCDYSASYQASEKHTFISELVVYDVNEQKCQTACQKHRPMGVSACNDFDKSVYYTAKTEYGKIFSGFNFNQYYHRYYVNQKYKELASQVPFYLLFIFLFNAINS